MTNATTEVTLRAARGTDLPAVLALLVSHRLPTDGVADGFGGFIVAEVGGAVVGVIGLEVHGDEYGLLRSAAVAEASRRHGVGRKLVERLLADAAARGVREIYLLTETAQAWFPRFGFETTTRDRVPAPVRGSVEFTKACPASAVVLVRRAPQARRLQGPDSV